MTKPWEYIFRDDTLPTSSEQVDRDVIRDRGQTGGELKFNNASLSLHQ